MPTGVELTSRLIALEDLNLTTNPSGSTYSGTVLGLGTTVLNKIPAMLLSSLIQAANEMASTITANVAHGELYYNTTESAPAARVVPIRAVPTGTANSSNANFTFAATPLLLMFHKDGHLLVEGTEYTRSGAVCQFASGSGVATVSGQYVIRTSGSLFLPSWKGCDIVINSTTLTIQDVINSGLLITTASPSSGSQSWSCNGAPQANAKLEGIYWT